MVALDLALRPFAETGLWIAFIGAYLLRAAALGRYLPALVASVADRAAPA